MCRRENKKISGAKASLCPHTTYYLVTYKYHALFDPAPVFTTFYAVHGHL